MAFEFAQQRRVGAIRLIKQGGKIFGTMSQTIELLEHFWLSQALALRLLLSFADALLEFIELGFLGFFKRCGWNFRGFTSKLIGLGHEFTALTFIKYHWQSGWQWCKKTADQQQ